MTIVPPSAKKHSLRGIGEASASSAIAALSLNPSTSFLTAGLSGKILFWTLTQVFSGLASMGLVILNVGAEKLAVVLDRVDFDGSMAAAEKFIDEVRKVGRDLTPEEVKKIDDEVIIAFRKFAKIARKK